VKWKAVNDPTVMLIQAQATELGEQATGARLSKTRDKVNAEKTFSEDIGGSRITTQEVR